MNNNIKKLLKLIEDNPNLPVVPLVEDICGGIYDKMIEEIRNSYIGKYLIADHALYLYNPKDLKNVRKTIKDIVINNSLQDNKELLEIYENLDWTEAILVEVGGW